jgi:hypothetical protein
VTTLRIINVGMLRTKQKRRRNQPMFVPNLRILRRRVVQRNNNQPDIYGFLHRVEIELWEATIVAASK